MYFLTRHRLTRSAQNYLTCSRIFLDAPLNLFKGGRYCNNAIINSLITSTPSWPPLYRPSSFTLDCTANRDLEDLARSLGVWSGPGWRAHLGKTIVIIVRSSLHMSCTCSASLDSVSLHPWWRRGRPKGHGPPRRYYTSHNLHYLATAIHRH